MTLEHRPERPKNPIFDFRWWLAPLMLVLTAAAGAFLLHGETRPGANPPARQADAAVPQPAAPLTVPPAVPPTSDDLPEPQPPTF